MPKPMGENTHEQSKGKGNSREFQTKGFRPDSKNLLSILGPNSFWQNLPMWIASLTFLIFGYLDRREIHYDDAAITFRYAQRLATGHGFTYNDFDQTNGASAPLYTLVLTIFRVFGADLQTAATVLGVIFYSLTGLLTFALIKKFSNNLLASAGSFALLSIPFFREQMNSGMESAFAVTLGLAAVFFVSEKRFVVAGLIGGIAVFNKFDAVFLYSGVMAACWVGLKNVPWKPFLASVVSLSPWLIFSTLYFGSPIPYSASQKLKNITGGVTETRDPAANFDVLWLTKILAFWSGPIVLIGAVALAAIYIFRKKLYGYPSTPRVEPTFNLVLLSLITWFSLHFAAFSFLDLGAGYPWYSTVLFPPLIVISVLLVAQISMLPMVQLQRSGLALLGSIAIVVAATVPSSGQNLSELNRLLRDGHFVSDYEAFEKTRFAAGKYISSNALNSDVIETCFGWVAFANPYNSIQETCPLSTRLPVAQSTWAVDVKFPGLFVDYLPPEGWAVGKRFQSLQGGQGESLVLIRDPEAKSAQRLSW